MHCPLCIGQMKFCFAAKVLQKYMADYEVCSNCGFLRVREPHWLGEAYSSAIAAADTGLVARNVSLSRKVAGALYWVMGERGQGRYLDAAGGYGMLTRLMRDLGFNFYWADKYCVNLLARGFEYDFGLGTCRAVTAMEVLEHVVDPASFIEEAMGATGAQTLLFTTELYEGVPPCPNDWWYYSFSTGQHISFFQRRTLELLGARLGLRFSSENGLHIFSKTKINDIHLNLATGRFSLRLSPWWIRQRLGSKVMSDYELITQGAANVPRA